LLDLSNKPELNGLSRLVRDLRAVAQPLGIPFFLMGAAARDLMVHHAHGIQARRGTEDADFAVMVPDWGTYQDLRSALIASGEFSPRPGPATHRLRHVSGMPLDIVPFGGIERRDRTVAWPPDEREVFNCFGVDEAFAGSVDVALPDGTEVKVAPVAAQAILKITAWLDRKHTDPGRDAGDLFLFLRHYMDLGNFDRAATEHSDLFEADDFDYVEAGTKLLARDMASLLESSGTEPLLSILRPEADEDGALLLASQSGMELERAHRPLQVLCAELARTRG
jgi:predicted nucleotidyltransferase